MLHNIFSIYDVKAEAYLPPFFMNTKGQATRAIADCVNDINHQFHAHPEDYTIFHLGAFEDTTGVIELNNAPQSMANCIELLIQISENPVEDNS